MRESRRPAEFAMRANIRFVLIAATLWIVLSLLPLGKSWSAQAHTLTGVMAVSAGGHHACALTTAGGVKCWGANTGGELGNNSAKDSTTPVDVVGLSTGIIAVSAGDLHTCVLTTAGGVKCWGSNSSGQLGNGTFVGSTTPVDVTGLTSGVVAVSAGYSDSCAVTGTGGVKCWGDNKSGEIGATTTETCATQIARFGPVPCTSLPVDAVGLSSGIVAVSAGEGHTCALTAAGGVKCWGYNLRGMLGVGTTPTSGCECVPTPMDVVSLTNGVTSISAGGFNSCALTTAGGVKCWGQNDRGELGNGTTSLSSTPVDVAGLTGGARAISAGTWHTCALATTGGVKCWGDGGGGELGNGIYPGQPCGPGSYCSTSPVEVTGLADGVAISAGDFFTCAVVTTGGVKCWGRNDSGTLGATTTETCIFTCSTTPVDVTLESMPSTGTGPGPSVNLSCYFLFALILTGTTAAIGGLIATRRAHSR